MADESGSAEGDVLMLTTDRKGDVQLTEAQWEIADGIARQLAKEEKGLLNELKKIISYLRFTIEEKKEEKKNIGENFFNYLKELVRYGNSIGHSKQTTEYYRSICEVCENHLVQYKDDPRKLLLFLGWIERLARYHKAGSPAGEIKVPIIKSEREIERERAVRDNKFEVGQHLDAEIVSIKKKKVTYKMIRDIKLTNSEHKLLKAGLLSEGQTLKVEIVEMKDDGNIKKIKPILENP